MSAPVLFIVACGIAVLATAILGYYRSLEAVRLQFLELFSDKFAAASEKFLASDQEIPLKILNDLSYWNELVADKQMSKRVAVTLLYNKFFKVKAYHENGEDFELDDALANRLNFLPEFNMVRIYAVGVACCRSRFFGLTVQPSLVVFLDHLLEENNETQAKTFAYSIKEKVRSRTRGSLHEVSASA